MAGSNAHWGQSAVKFVKGAATIVASVAVATVGLWAISEVLTSLDPEIWKESKEFAGDLLKDAGEFLKSIPSYAEAGMQQLQEFWAALTAPTPPTEGIAGTLRSGWDTYAEAYHTNDWVKGGTWAGAAGLGLYTVSTAANNWRNKVRESSPPPSRPKPRGDDFRDLVTKLRASRTGAERA